MTTGCGARSFGVAGVDGVCVATASLNMASEVHYLFVEFGFNLFVDFVDIWFDFEHFFNQFFILTFELCVALKCFRNSFFNLPFDLGSCLNMGLAGFQD